MAHTHTLLWSSFERAAIISASNPIPNPNPNQVDISWNTFITQGVGPLCTRQRTWGCERRAQTLGDMLHRASCNGSPLEPHPRPPTLLRGAPR